MSHSPFLLAVIPFAAVHLNMGRLLGASSIYLWKITIMSEPIALDDVFARAAHEAQKRAVFADWHGGCSLSYSLSCVPT